MYLEISNPMNYHVALYIRLSKEDETEGPSQSVTNQKSLLNEFVQQHRLSVYDTYPATVCSGQQPAAWPLPVPRPHTADAGILHIWRSPQY